MTELQILQTNYGLDIYAHSLLSFYPHDSHISKLSEEWHLPTSNPFNGGRQTLRFRYANGMFIFFDTEREHLKGNPLDFARICLQKEGDELLKIIDNCTKKHNYDFKIQENNRENCVKSVSERFNYSYFHSPISNTTPSKATSIREIFNLIRGGKFKVQTDKLRAIVDQSRARNFKANNFDYVTFAGTFSKRNDNAQLSDSGLMVIDFDHIQNLDALKNRLLTDEYFETELMFVSPSGDGLKWVIPIDFSNENRALKFEAISNYISLEYGIEIDKSGKDASRACFLPHDPYAYINPKHL